jgi:hypothetical protein
MRAEAALLGAARASDAARTSNIATLVSAPPTAIPMATTTTVTTAANRTTPTPGIRARTATTNDHVTKRVLAALAMLAMASLSTAFVGTGGAAQGARKHRQREMLRLRARPKIWPTCATDSAMKAFGIAVVAAIMLAAVAAASLSFFQETVVQAYRTGADRLDYQESVNSYAR